MTIILVESIDRVGKSTLCELLSKRLNCEVFHDKHKPLYVQNSGIVKGNELLFNDFLESKFTILIQMLKMFDNVVVDRFHITEKVYDLIREQDFEQYEKIDKMLSKLDLKLILVEPENIKKSSNEHGSDLSIHYAAFRMFYDLSMIKRKVIIKQHDIFNNPEEVLRKIIK